MKDFNAKTLLLGVTTLFVRELLPFNSATVKFLGMNRDTVYFTYDGREGQSGY